MSLSDLDFGIVFNGKIHHIGTVIELITYLDVILEWRKTPGNRYMDMSAVSSNAFHFQMWTSIQVFFFLFWETFKPFNSADPDQTL